MFFKGDKFSGGYLTSLLSHCSILWHKLTLLSLLLKQQVFHSLYDVFQF